MKSAAWIVAIFLLGYPLRACAAPMDIQKGSFDSAGVRIFYLQAGTGQDVVLIHGLYSSAAMNWVAPGTFGLLAQHYHVIALDLRGHGMSDKPTDDAAYGQPMVDDVLRLMDHLHVRKAHIVGYSLGGIIALKFISDHPDRVISGALGGMGWLRPDSIEQKSFEHLGGRAGEVNRSSTPPACVHGIARLAITEAQVDAIRTPVEMLVGDRDPCRGMYVAPLHAARPDFPVIVIDGAGHLNCIFQKQFQSELEIWINKNSR